MAGDGVANDLAVLPNDVASIGCVRVKLYLGTSSGPYCRVELYVYFLLLLVD